MFPQLRAKLARSCGNKGEKNSLERLLLRCNQIYSRLGEDSDLFRERTAKLRCEWEMERRRNQPNRAKKKKKDYER